MKLVFMALVCATTMSCVNRKDHKIMKHPLDKSQIRKIVLENRLKVYLLSDSSFNVSAASMSVMVGSLENPEDRQGLAHFLEHMLFLGTEKYPDVDEYSTYLRTNGGFSNAYTASDHTNYQLQVLPGAFEGALDRFSQFFIGPLFTEQYTEREVNAVNSEHQKNIMNDGWRQYRISGLFAKEGHPERMFNTGNLETLGDIDREELITFYNAHYSANRMGLAVLSTHSLDEMEGWVREYFSEIKNSNPKKNIHDPDVMERKNTFRLVKIDPVKDIRDLIIEFSIPGTRKLYKQKPGSQLGFILGHEGQGSLLSFLKSKGWATTLSAGAGSQTNEYGAASIRIGLTQQGLDEYKHVINATMGFIQLMQKSGHQKHVFNELKTMAELEEIYANKGEGMWRATQLANELNMYDFTDAGRINYIYGDPDPEKFEALLQYLTPENMFVMLVSKGLETNQIEDFYQAPYAYTEDDSFYEELQSIVPHSSFKIAAPNPFIPKKARVPNRGIKDEIEPKLIIDTKGSKLYFGQDHEFLRPKGIVSYKIMFSKDRMNLRHRVLLKIYAACVRESMNELGYPAKQAGLNYSLVEGYEGLYLTVSGYTESAIKLYEMMLDHMIGFDISNDQFEAIKDKIVRDYQNFPLSDAWQQTRDKSAEIYHSVKFSWAESLPVAQSATQKDIQEFAEKLYKEIFIEGFVYGDFEEIDARKTIRVFKEKTNAGEMKREQAFELDFLKQGESEDIQYVDVLRVNNSCFWREYEFGKDSPQMRASALVISQAVQQPFYTEMRTNQQLGYIVWSRSIDRDETHYMTFAIQSGEYSADDLNVRADAFITTLPEFIRTMDTATFRQLVESAIEQLEKEPKSIAERANKLKDLVFEHSADFDRDKKTISALKSVDQNSLADLLFNTINESSRKMVNSLMFAEQHNNKENYISSFDDIKSWKKSRIYQ